MALTIDRFPDTDAARAAARRLNERLQQGGIAEFELTESPFSRRFPEGPDSLFWQQYYLALDTQADGSMEARGGYIFQFQHYQCGDTCEPQAYFKLPISEGIINKVFAPVGMLLLRDAVKRQPVVCSLGMGGVSRPLPRLMQGMGWHLHEVPFHFHVLSPFTFLRQTRALRANQFRSLACDALAFSGAGWLGAKLLQLRAPNYKPKGLRVTCEPDFGPWADQVWDKSHPHYAFCGARTSALLKTLYPVSDERWIRCVVWDGDTPLGWALLLCTAVVNHKQFGTLKLGSIADCLAAPEHAALVVDAAKAELRRRGAAVVVTNQTHAAWNDALKRCGFISGPTNFVWALSPAMKKKLDPVEERVNACHINRGDGDGPINL